MPKIENPGLEEVPRGQGEGSALPALKIEAGRYYEAENGDRCACLSAEADSVKVKWLTGDLASHELWMRENGAPLTEGRKYHLVKELPVSIGPIHIDPKASREVRDAVAELVRLAIEHVLKMEPK